MGLWISIEGVEGSGKTTLANELSRRRPDWLVLSGFTATPLGQVLSAGFRRDPYVPQPPASAQAMMALADFVIRWTNDIQPAIRQGRTVLTDRGWLSKLVYQVAILDASNQEQAAFTRTSVETLMGTIPFPAHSVLLLPDMTTVEQRLVSSGETVTSTRRDMLARLVALFQKYADGMERLTVVRDVQQPGELADLLLAQVDPLGVG
jgi:thymidylate kinase